MKHFSKLLSVIFSAAIVMSSLTAFGFSSAAVSSSSISLRIEGQKATVYSGTVDFTPGQDFYDIMTAALAAKGIPIVATMGQYGHEITSIGDESGTYPVWWHLYDNDKESDVGADSLLPKNGDNIVFYLGDDSVVQYPTITLSPKYPVEGKQSTINVDATYTDYTDANNPVQKTVQISGAAVSFDGKIYTTGSDGNTVITMPAAGSYTFKVTKETADTTPAIVRTGDIPLTVYTESTVPKDNGGSGTTTTTTTVTTPKTVSATTIRSAADAGANYITANGVNDWGSALVLESAGLSVPKSYFDAAKSDLDSYDGAVTPTHLAGVIIGLKAAGGDPSDFDGNNLVAQLYNMTNIGKTGLNGYAYALLALDCGKYTIPSAAANTHDKLIAGILSYQNKNGSFALDENSDPDCDMTAIAVSALSPYLDRSNVKSAVNSAVDYLSEAQKQDGGFVASYSTDETSESTSQVIIALASAGINPLTDTRFVKNGNSPISNLLSYKKADGSFGHVQAGGSDLIATEQAVQALSAYNKLVSGGTRLYDLSSVTAVSAATVANPNTGDGGVASTLVITVAAFLATIALRKKK
jgi:hypothetical protein